METLLISLVSVALVIVATVTMTLSTFSSTVTLTDSWVQMEQRAEEIRRTSISLTPPEGYSGGNIDLMVDNDGQTNLSDFSHWDVMVEYQTGTIQYLNYTENPSPGDNEWAIEGIYMTENTSMAESFDFDILNPWETANVTMKLNPQIGAGESGRITVSTANGVTSQCILIRP